MIINFFHPLDFIREFLLSLSKLDPCDKTSGVCQTAYNQTLAQFHPWLVRKGAIVAMYTMPTRDQLLTKVCIDVDNAIRILPEMLEVTKDVFDRTHEMYVTYDLNELP